MMSEKLTLDNRCIFCGDIIPEGRMICHTCENKYSVTSDLNCGTVLYVEGKENLFMKLLGKNLFLFYIVSFTWGIITSLIGLLLMIPFIFTKRVFKTNGRLYGVFPKSFGCGWGFTMGCFFFVSWDCYSDKTIRLHEMGHGLQNCIFGPLMILIINIPSFIRFWYREIFFYRRNRLPKTRYDAIWFEHQADVFGKKYIIGDYNE